MTIWWQNWPIYHCVFFRFWNILVCVRSQYQKSWQIVCRARMFFPQLILMVRSLYFLRLREEGPRQILLVSNSFKGWSVITNSYFQYFISHMVDYITISYFQCFISQMVDFILLIHNSTFATQHQMFAILARRANW